MAVVAGPLWTMSERAAFELLEGDPYVETVLAGADVTGSETDVVDALDGAVGGDD